MISLLLADGRLNVSSISGLERALRFVNWFSNNQAPTTKSTVSCASSASFKRCFWDEYPKIATAAETNRSEGDSKSRTNDSPKFAEASSSSLKPKKSCEEKKKLRRKERKRRRRENGFGERIFAASHSSQEEKNVVVRSRSRTEEHHEDDAKGTVFRRNRQHGERQDRNVHKPADREKRSRESRVQDDRWEEGAIGGIRQLEECQGDL
ncbi:hypothetical protein L596_009008 [Steinernema carpocapsae]|uniref:Uncharacterized protein n=1 Tax=Steinernema carpocapsae TaxID=34508 RepID=A0A4U5PEA7_STECR|nr:hypothetical protein L596_009008 [Steinernema carpocapsae]